MVNSLYSRRLNWTNSRAVCLGLEGDLVSIENEREIEFIKNLTSNLKNHLYWIGLNDRLKEGEFVWSDGTPFEYDDWRYGEPNNVGNEDCARLSRDKWNDQPCRLNYHYICERPKGGMIFLCFWLYLTW